jgi:uridylate kinase
MMVRQRSPIDNRMTGETSATSRMPSRRAPARAPVVLSVGGSIFLTGEDDAQYLRDLAAVLRRVAQRFPLVVTVGGGPTAREYIDLGRRLGLTEVELDELGIDVTRLHARLLAGHLGAPVPTDPPTTIAQAVYEAQRVPLVVLGGTEPGHTTDGVAAVVAARLRAQRMVNATNVPGLFDADPRAHRSARQIPQISWPKFRAMVHASASGEAGQEFLFDRLGADALARAKIPLRIVDGRNLPNLERALRGESFEGTAVH